jgi:hypothetical protein
VDEAVGSIIGEVATWLARAAVHAIRTGAKRSDRHVVDAPVAIRHRAGDVDRWSGRCSDVTQSLVWMICRT